MKRCFTVLAIAATVLAIMCGAAFAAASDVADVINASVLGTSGLTATASNSTVTVTGTAQVEKTGPVEMVDLGDLDGATIDWQADLTVIAGSQINDDGNVIFSANGSGTFKMTSGKIEIVSTAGRKASQVWVFAGSGTDIVLSGGVVSGEHADDRGFGAPASLTLDGATVYLPNGLISDRVEKLNKNKIENVTGAMPTLTPGDENDRGFEMFGAFTHTIKDSWILQTEGVHYTLKVNKGADVTFTIEDLSTAKTTFSAEVEGKVDFTRITGTLTSLVVKPGGVAVIAGNSICAIDETIVQRNVTTAGGEVSAAASATPNSEYGILEVEGKLTIPAGKTLQLGNIKGLVNSGGTLQVDGKIELPSGTTADDMKKIAGDLGITGNVFEMDGKTYNEKGEQTGSSSSGSGCAAGALAPLAIAALALSKLRKN